MMCPYRLILRKSLLIDIIVIYTILHVYVADIYIIYYIPLTSLLIENCYLICISQMARCTLSQNTI